MATTEVTIGSDLHPQLKPASLDGGIAVFNTLDHLKIYEESINLDRTLMVMCVAGEISATIDLTYRRMTAGTVMVLRGGHVLSQITQGEGFEGFFIIADNSKIDDMLPMHPYLAPCELYFKDNPIIEASENEIANLKLIYDLFTRSRQSRLPYRRLTLNSICEVLFYETLGLYTSKMTRHTHKPTRREELLSKFISLVEKNFMRERTVLFYAREMCLSPKHLSAVVKESSGRTAGEWIDSQVILKAKLLLRNTGMTIQEIAAEMNFSNQSFFGKYFKQKTGVSPRAFRSNPDR